tara:strand:+ start:2320 stop:3324 length:1005 start_codon:yes stop_codon:yes gene_type:complete
MYIYYGIIIFFLIIYLLVPEKFLKIEDRNLHQKFTTDHIPPALGGYFLILTLFFNNQIDLTQKFLFFLIFLSGTLSDFKILNSPTFRLVFQTLIILIFVYLTDLYLENTKIIFLDNLLENFYFNLFFCYFCIVILVNGTNFIDGLNGLVSGYYAIVVFLLHFTGISSEIVNFQFVTLLIFVLFLMSLLNLFNKIYIGDSGSYLIGFFMAFYLITIYLYNQNLSPFFIILLIWYPCFEILFSIFRKYKLSVSPFSPDNSHLHQLLFKYLSKKISFKKNYINNFSSVLILFYNFLIILISLNDISNTKFQVLLIIINIFVYIISYFFIKKKLLIFR